MTKIETIKAFSADEIKATLKKEMIPDDFRKALSVIKHFLQYSDHQ